LMAYRCLSILPTYTVPSDPTAGDEKIKPPVRNFHFCVPFALMAYRLLS
jgi:hypothetical protein